MEIERYTGHHENGNVKYESSYLDGLRHGIQKVWYENGNMKLCRLRIYGDIHGIDESWSQDGSRKFIYQNRNGIWIND